MPGEIVGELILRPILEVALQIFAYFTGRVIVPLFSFGMAYVEPAPKGVRVVVPKWHGFHRGSRGKIVVDCEMGALLGLLFWFFVVIVYFYAFGDAT
jgi:hypothetical protein